MPDRHGTSSGQVRVHRQTCYRERRCRTAVRTALTTHTLRQSQQRASWMLLSRSTRASSLQPGADDQHKTLQELHCVFPFCAGADRGCACLRSQCCAGCEANTLTRTGVIMRVPLCRYNLGNQLSSLSVTKKEGELTYTASVNSRQVCCRT